MSADEPLACVHACSVAWAWAAGTTPSVEVLMSADEPLACVHACSVAWACRRVARVQRDAHGARPQRVRTHCSLRSV